MDVELFFRGFLLAALIVIKIVRAVYHWRPGGVGFREGWRQNPGDFVLLLVCAVPMSVAVIGYLAVPGWVAWAGVEVPAILRWMGCGVVVAATGYYVRVQGALGSNFSPVFRHRSSLPHPWTRIGFFPRTARGNL